MVFTRILTGNCRAGKWIHTWVSWFWLERLRQVLWQQNSGLWTFVQRSTLAPNLCTQPSVKADGPHFQIQQLIRNLKSLKMQLLQIFYNLNFLKLWVINHFFSQISFHNRKNRFSTFLLITVVNYSNSCQAILIKNQRHVIQNCKWGGSRLHIIHRKTEGYIGKLCGGKALPMDIIREWCWLVIHWNKREVTHPALDHRILRFQAKVNLQQKIKVKLK